MFCCDPSIHAWIRAYICNSNTCISLHFILFPTVPAEAANDQPEVKIRPTSNGAMTAEVIFQV